MDTNKILEELTPIFHDVFDDEGIVLTPQTNANDIEDWDSVAQIRLVVAIEKKFGIKFKTDDLENLNNVGEMAELIAKLSDR